MGGTQQAGLVVVALGGEVGVAAGEVKQGPVLLQRLVAEGAECEVVRAIALHLNGRTLAKDFPLELDAVALGHQGADGFGGLLQLEQKLGNLDGPVIHSQELHLDLVGRLLFLGDVIEHLEIPHQ